uniref:Uncharacterized protein n=1 Tax=Pithovirus LCPAC001 TaxID=2506585 RepID=A0A481Z2I7_9VIRU|nr:MAG: hypothetical protein LCPAC001_00190 [Pithovirus LCPAC001]
MDNTNNDSPWHIVNFILIFIVVIFIIIALIEIYNHRALVENLLPGWNIEEGISDQSSDSFTISASNLYIGQSNQNLNLNLIGGVSWTGSQFGIKNNSLNTITLLPGAGIEVSPDQNFLISPGVFSTWVHTSDGILRLDKAEIPLTDLTQTTSTSVSSVQNPTQNIILDF